MMINTISGGQSYGRFKNAFITPMSDLLNEDQCSVQFQTLLLDSFYFFLQMLDSFVNNHILG